MVPCIVYRYNITLKMKRMKLAYEKYFSNYTGSSFGIIILRMFCMTWKKFPLSLRLRTLAMGKKRFR